MAVRRRERLSLEMVLLCVVVALSSANEAAIMVATYEFNPLALSVRNATGVTTAPSNPLNNRSEAKGKWEG